jgi:hypothetical protein
MSTERRAGRVGSLLLAALCVAHCGGSVTSQNQDGGTADRATSESSTDAPARPGAPKNHRPSDAQCLTTPAPQNCNMGGSCDKDTDCTKGLNGRCVVSGADAIMCACSYDLCTSDTQCKMGGPCSCHDSAYMGGIGNTCVPGNCRVDADCEGGKGYCSPSDAQVGCGGLPSYYCHTPSDSCVNDSDCGGGNGCVYQVKPPRWECQQILGCG